MLADFGLVALFLIVAVIFAATTILIPVTLKYLRVVPKKPSAAKSSTYECGMTTIGKTWIQFNFRYYFYALIFLALDVLVVFLYPWAVQLKQLGAFGLYVVLILVFIVLVGYIYAWKKKALEWK